MQDEAVTKSSQLLRSALAQDKRNDERSAYEPRQSNQLLGSTLSENQ